MTGRSSAIAGGARDPDRRPRKRRLAVAGVDAHRADAASDVVAFYATGLRIVGDFRCSDCGYGIVCRSELPICPMCHGSRWEATPWRPFTRAKVS